MKERFNQDVSSDRGAEDQGSTQKTFNDRRLIKLAIERQVNGYQNKPGIYLAVDKGFDPVIKSGRSTNSDETESDSLAIYTETCEKATKSALGEVSLEGILLKTLELGKMGTEMDARMQVNRDLIAGPFETESEAMEIAPYVLRERYGWDPKRIKKINFYSLCA